MIRPGVLLYPDQPQPYPEGNREGRVLAGYEVTKPKAAHLALLGFGEAGRAFTAGWRMAATGVGGAKGRGSGLT